MVRCKSRINCAHMNHFCIVAPLSFLLCIDWCYSTYSLLLLFCFKLWKFYVKDWPADLDLDCYFLTNPPSTMLTRDLLSSHLVCPFKNWLLFSKRFWNLKIIFQIFLLFPVEFFAHTVRKVWRSKIELCVNWMVQWLTGEWGLQHP